MGKALLLYPERQRCRRCRRYFGFVVIQRQWCSEECAGVEYNLETAPRQCKTPDRDAPGGWRWKRVWWTEAAARRAVRRNGAKDFYRCEGCWGYHLTKQTPEERAAKEYLRSQQAS